MLKNDVDISWQYVNIIDIYLQQKMMTIHRSYQWKLEKYQKVQKKLYELQNLVNQKYDYFIKVLNRYEKSIFVLMKRKFHVLQECPSGAVTEREFQTIYSHFFPHGNCQNYTSFLFRVLDRRKRMYFTFEVIFSYTCKNN